MSAAHVVQLVDAGDLHQQVIIDHVLNAKRFVWIATADLKDMHVRDGKTFVPILDVFDRMARRGVRFRIIHSALPSRPFRRTLEDYPELTDGALELQVCPRSHWKLVVVDGAFGYCGSANFTGAGLGVKSQKKRNLEMGVVSSEPEWVEALSGAFDDFWMGNHCDDCGRRDVCPDPIR